jgi:hypothetical protein
MAYVPGFDCDIFVSYAHGDDRDWVSGFVDRLREELRKLMGRPVEIWLDRDDLRYTRDFQMEIPDSVKKSALFLLLPSPTYLGSRYCVEVECRAFQSTLEAHRLRFKQNEFRNELFALRCPILPIEGNAHWNLFSGLTDIPFFKDLETLVLDSATFRESFRILVRTSMDLLRRMRNQCVSVFVYPPDPKPEFADAQKRLIAELTAQSYRVVPELRVDFQHSLQEAALSVFLLGGEYDETTDDLTTSAATLGKPWVVWLSNAANKSVDPPQQALCSDLANNNSSRKTFLREDTGNADLKGEILEILHPAALAPASRRGKPFVYLVYDAAANADAAHAGGIARAYRRDFQFEYSPKNSDAHEQKLTDSDGVLLVWGSADESWYAREFERMYRLSRNGAKGVCAFDPREQKLTLIEQVRQNFSNVAMADEFGPFDSARLDPFFRLLHEPRPTQV